MLVPERKPFGQKRLPSKTGPLWAKSLSHIGEIGPGFGLILKPFPADFRKYTYHPYPYMMTCWHIRAKHPGKFQNPPRSTANVPSDVDPPSKLPPQATGYLEGRGGGGGRASFEQAGGGGEGVLDPKLGVPKMA